MHCLGGVGLQEIIHQAVQQHRPSICKTQVELDCQSCNKTLPGIITDPVANIERFITLTQQYLTGPVLRCSLIRPLISSSWRRSEVSSRGSRSPTLSCSLDMVVLRVRRRVSLKQSRERGRTLRRHSHAVPCPVQPGGVPGPPVDTVSRHHCKTNLRTYITCQETPASINYS